MPGIIDNDKKLPFADLLAKDGMASYTQKNYKFLPLKCSKYIRTCREN